MSIEVLPKVVHRESELHCITFEEAVIVQHIYSTMGKIQAIRVVRAFAQCGLIDAKNYVDKLKLKREE